MDNLPQFDSEQLAQYFQQNGWRVSAKDLISSDPTRGSVQYSSFQEGEIALSLLHSAAAISRPSVLVTERGEILGESVIYPALAPTFPANARQIIKLDHSKKLSGTFLFLDGIYSEYFWHWVMEYLPRVLIARKTAYKGYFVISDQAPAFVKESLDLLQVPSDRIIERGAETWFVESLAITEGITGTPGHGRIDLTRYPSLLRLLRTGLLRRIQGDPRAFGLRERDEKSGTRLYISRRNATRGRRIRNEPELESLLREFGFEIVVFEELSLGEQIAKVMTSSVLCGAHGAGMLHSLCLPEGSTVIEFFSPQFIPDTNRFVLETFGHIHIAITGVDVVEDRDVDPNLQDITLDLGIVRRALEERLPEAL